MRETAGGRPLRGSARCAPPGRPTPPAARGRGRLEGALGPALGVEIPLAEAEPAAPLRRGAEDSEVAPAAVLVGARPGAEEESVPEASLAAARRALELAQAPGLARKPLAESCLVFSLRAKVRSPAPTARTPLDLAVAPLAGLCCTRAASEHPGRFALIDSDGLGSLPRGLFSGAARGSSADEPQLALREGELLAPPTGTAHSLHRGRRCRPPLRSIPSRRRPDHRRPRRSSVPSSLGIWWSPTVPAACSWPDEDGPGAEGAEGVEGRAGGTWAGRLTSSPATSPTARQLPCAPRLDPARSSAGGRGPCRRRDSTMAADGVARRLSRLAGPRPKLDAACHLHEADRRPSTLSALRSLLRGRRPLHADPGQGNYAAANAFLDALAHPAAPTGFPPSRSPGAPGGATRHDAPLADADLRARSARRALPRSPPELGLALFDARARPPAPAAPSRCAFDGAALRARARAGSCRRSFAAWFAPRRAAARRPARWRTAWPPARAGAPGHRARARPQPRSPPFSATPRRRRSSPTAPSRSSASTRWPRSSCATASPPPPACGCRRPLVFDHPSPQALAAFLLGEAGAAGGAAPVASRRPGLERGADRHRRHGAATPAGWSSPEELWELLAGGDDGISELPDRPRLGPRAPLRPRPRRPGTTYARDGGFLDDAGDFDAEFFGISPREALADRSPAAPAARVPWEALSAPASPRPRCTAPDRRLRRRHVPRLRDGRPGLGRARGHGTGTPASPPVASPTPSASRARR